MAHLLEPVHDPIDPSDTIGWPEALLKTHGKDQCDRNLFEERFATSSINVYSLFPHVRKLERDLESFSHKR